MRLYVYWRVSSVHGYTSFMRHVHASMTFIANYTMLDALLFACNCVYFNFLGKVYVLNIYIYPDR